MSKLELKVLEMLNSGIKPKVIIAKLKCSTSFPYLVAMKNGIKLNKKRTRVLEIANYSVTHGVIKTCKKFKCSKNQVYSYRSRFIKI